MKTITFRWTEPETGLQRSWDFTLAEIAAISRMQPNDEAKSVVLLESSGARLDLTADGRRCILAANDGVEASVDFHEILSFAAQSAQ